MKCVSPCENCRRVTEPGNCEDKTCVRWRKWYLKHWALIHGYYEACKGRRRG